MSTEPGQLHYLAKACACSRRADPNVWSEVTIRRLPDGDAEAAGRKSTYAWCAKHIDETCEAVLAGKKKRPVSTSRTTPAKSPAKSTTKSTPSTGSRSGATPRGAGPKTAPKTSKSSTATATAPKRAEAKVAVKSSVRKPTPSKPKPARR